MYYLSYLLYVILIWCLYIYASLTQDTIYYDITIIFLDLNLFSGRPVELKERGKMSMTLGLLINMCYVAKLLI